MAEMPGAKSSVKEASFTGQTPEPFPAIRQAWLKRGLHAIAALP